MTDDEIRAATVTLMGAGGSSAALAMFGAKIGMGAVVSSEPILSKDGDVLGSIERCDAFDGTTPADDVMRTIDRMMNIAMMFGDVPRTLYVSPEADRMFTREIGNPYLSPDVRKEIVRPWRSVIAEHAAARPYGAGGRGSLPTKKRKARKAARKARKITKRNG